MSGGQGDSTAAKVSLDQPGDAVEMDKINLSQPAVPAKNDTAAARDLGVSAGKGKEKETLPLANRPDRTDSLTIGAADAPAQISNPADGPVCNITLLLPTGARHPYKIDDKYLTKRSVEVPEVTENGKKDPFSISVYKLKELILREWRDEWDNKPASPSSIRLIHFGKLLDDKEQLKSKRPQSIPEKHFITVSNTSTCLQSTSLAPRPRMSFTCPSSQPKCWKRTKLARVKAMAVAAETVRAGQVAVSYYKGTSAVGRCVHHRRAHHSGLRTKTTPQCTPVYHGAQRVECIETNHHQDYHTTSECSIFGAQAVDIVTRRWSS